jgi:sulfite reductase alpha subunit-like flavoprotein
VEYYYPTILTTLEQFPGVEPDAGVLTSILPILQPRLYSVSSSPKTKNGENKEIHLTVSVVAYDTPDGSRHHGVATSYLNSLPVGSQVSAFVRRFASNKLKAELD